MQRAPIRHRGTLVCVVLKAKNLPNKRTIGKQDPFAELLLDDTALCTKPDRRGGQSPLWDEQLHFEIYSELGEAIPAKVLRITCYAMERNPDYIGHGELPLNTVLQRGEHDHWVQLMCDGRYVGEVYVELTFYSLDPPPMRAPPHEPLAPASPAQLPPPPPSHPLAATMTQSRAASLVLASSRSPPPLPQRTASSGPRPRSPVPNSPSPIPRSRSPAATSPHSPSWNTPSHATLAASPRHLPTPQNSSCATTATPPLPQQSQPWGPATDTPPPLPRRPQRSMTDGPSALHMTHVWDALPLSPVPSQSSDEPSMEMACVTSPTPVETNAPRTSLSGLSTGASSPRPRRTVRSDAVAAAVAAAALASPDSARLQHITAHEAIYGVPSPRPLPSPSPRRPLPSPRSARTVHAPTGMTASTSLPQRLSEVMHNNTSLSNPPPPPARMPRSLSGWEAH